MLNANQELQRGRYRIIRQLDQEQSNSLYEARDNVLAKNVLLGVENIVSPGGETGNENFTDQAKFLSEIKHDGFLQILEHFSEGGKHFFVMETADGKTLDEIVGSGEKIVSPASVMDWGMQILDALDYLHRQNPAVLYFNLKPSNVYLTSDGKIKLLTTEIAGKSGSDGKINKQAFENSNLNYSPLEVIWEKLDAASQRVILNGFDENSEQSLMQQPDARCDIYALGATLYHLLTGKIPMGALERSIEILEGNPDPLAAPTKINPNIAVELSDVLMTALRIKREYRFHTALEMREELGNVFVLLRERKILELRSKTPAAPAVLSAELKKSAGKNQNLSYEPLRKKTGEAAQLEFIKQKLRETEAQKISAEKRAAEAERRLIEIEKNRSRDEDVLELTEIPEFTFETPKNSQIVESENVEEILHAEIIEDSSDEGEILFEEAEIVESEIAENYVFDEEISVKLKNDSSEDFENLFAAPQKENKFFKRMAAAVIGLLILGGGVWAAFNYLPLSPPNREVLNQTVSEVEATNAEPPPVVEATPEVETTPEIAAEISPESNDEAKISEESLNNKPNLSDTRETSAPVKQKTYVPQIANVKQPERKSAAVTEQKKKSKFDEPTNAAPAKKKKITVDDLINN